MATEINGGSGYFTLFSTKAHVFQINPITNNSWLQKGDHAIPISIVTNNIHDQDKITSEEFSSKRELRIIGYDDNDNKVLDATILPKTVFTQKTPKFGQWFDHNKKLHGLGFDSPDEFTEFIEKFQHFQHEIFKSPPSHAPLELPRVRDKLVYENERLKQALEESSRNAGIWHNELLTLRTNNLKLTQALQDSKSNVDEWDRELVSLRDENKELKMRISALESANNTADGESNHKKDLQKYKIYVDEVTSNLRRKENEIEQLQRHMEELELKASQQHSQSTCLNDKSATNPIQKQKLDIINAKFEAKLSELANVQKEFGQFLDKLAY